MPRSYLLAAMTYCATAGGMACRMLLRHTARRYIPSAVAASSCRALSLSAFPLTPSSRVTLSSCLNAPSIGLGQAGSAFPHHHQNVSESLLSAVHARSLLSLSPSPVTSLGSLFQTGVHHFGLSLAIGRK